MNFEKSYTADDQLAVERILKWQKKQGKTQSWIAKLSRVATGTINPVLSGKYPSSPSKTLNKIQRAIDDYMDTSELDESMFIKTTVYNTVIATCRQARISKSFGVAVGLTGLGKTTAIKRYAEETPNTLLVEADPNMTVRALLDDLIEAADISLGKNKNIHSKFRTLVSELRGSNTLIILDEADTVAVNTLEYLRRLMDKASVGIVLVGTEKLYGILRPEAGQFDQLRNRVQLWPTIMKQIKREDADAYIAQSIS